MEDQSIRFTGTGPVAPPPRPVMFGRGAPAMSGSGRPGPGPPAQSPPPGIAAGGGGFKLSGAAASTTAANANGARHRPESRSPPPRTRSGIPSGRGKGPGLARIPSSSEDAREEEAKARRMKRFGADKADLVPSVREVPVAPVVSLLSENMAVGDQMVEDQDWSVMEGGDAILGTCPDMCPEVERLARERKGDLDKFERLDGERTQSSVHLAVKKYTRTAEKEASIIRPLPVLQRTMNHLLQLIDRPYDDELVSLHSFLWDRMRSVRTDLRMQHIFNLDAIAMHEQMIRFHILAMHELCEYTRGEGFNEGFDPHLNIEQMNKASVDLFEMYDDHRKRGTPVPSEAEFRGYYALLKLDKHPGYLVEPAELSLDLAKMTAEMRNTPEVLFARKVARASRSGNFIMFFRLAKRSTYLQACLMHAHFSKLRTHALYSLHSGLQKNQGIPVSQVVEWLGMEGEDVDILIAYSGRVGFSVKEYEKNYLVKEGPYSTWQSDFPTRRSRLVIAKRSVEVVADVQSRISSLKESVAWPIASMSVPGSPTPEEDMPDYEEEHQDVIVPNSVARSEIAFSSTQIDLSSPAWPTGSTSTSPDGSTSLNSWMGMHPEAQQVRNKRKTSEDAVTADKNQRVRRDMKAANNLQQNSDILVARRREEEDFQRTAAEAEEKRVQEIAVRRAEEVAQYRLQVAQRRAEEDAQKRAEEDEKRRLFAIAVARKKQEEELRLASNRAEAYAGKARLWLRRWKSRTKASLLWKQKRMERAEAALSSLSAGPPLLSQKQGSNMEVSLTTVDLVEFNVDQVFADRSKKLSQMWASLNISSLVAPTLIKNNFSRQCICWKLAICTRLHDQHSSANDIRGRHDNLLGEWLWTKMTINVAREHQNFQVLKNTDQGDNSCSVLVEDMDTIGGSFCYIAKDVAFNGMTLNAKESLYGASGILFLMSDAFDATAERCRLHSLLDAVAPGARLPLLILASSRWKNFDWKWNGDWDMKRGRTPEESLSNGLHLHTFDTSRVSSSSVVFLSERAESGGKLVNVFLDDKVLQESLRWLAEHAPKQPNLRSLHVRDLVLEHLDIESQSLTSLPPATVNPEDCIDVFNRAVRKASQDICDAASAVPLHWPPPEYESVLPSRRDMPRYGWNLPDTVQPILQVLHFCGLPPFPSQVLNERGVLCSARSSNERNDLLQSIDVQKTAIGQVLQRYICQVEGISENSLATRREVDEILQTGCMIDWLDIRRATVVPLWSQIFQRIFHSRLLLLCSEPPPIVSVLAQEKGPEVGIGGLSAKKVSFSGGYFYRKPRLDDIVQQYTISSRKRHDPVAHTRRKNFSAPDPVESWLSIPISTEGNAEVERAEEMVNVMLEQARERVVGHHREQIMDGASADGLLRPKDFGGSPSERRTSVVSVIEQNALIDGTKLVASENTTPSWARAETDKRLQKLIDSCEKAQAAVANHLEALGITSAREEHNWVLV